MPPPKNKAGSKNKTEGEAGGSKQKGAQSINVRHILVRIGGPLTVIGFT